jgi:hypothetical protein
MQTALETLITERREWREQRWRRLRKVSERCQVGWQNFCSALHRELILHNSGGTNLLGIRREDDTIEVNRIGHLSPVLTFALDAENAQVLYRAPLHQGSAFLDDEGAIAAVVLGSLFLVTAEGRLLKLSYYAAAQYFLAPIIDD